MGQLRLNEAGLYGGASATALEDPMALGIGRHDSQADKPLQFTQHSGVTNKAQGQFNRNKPNFACCLISVNVKTGEII